MSNNYYYEEKPDVFPLVNGGSPNIAVDGTTPAEFRYTPAATDIVEITRFMMVWITSGNVSRPDRFQSINSALTNGIDVSYVNDSNGKLLWNFMTNYDLYRLCSAKFLKNSLGNRDVTQIEFEFPQTIVLDGTKGDYFEVKISDDLSSLEDSGASIVGKTSPA